MSKLFYSFEELYEEFVAQVKTDSNQKLRDFSPGSALDAFAAIAAMASQSTMRYIGETITAFFIQTASGNNLDGLINDRYPEAPWLKRKTGESDEDLRARIYEYLKIKSRGTLPALKYFIQVVKSDTIENGEVEESFPQGAIIITGRFKSGRNSTVELTKLNIELEYWRPAGCAIYYKIQEAP